MTIHFLGSSGVRGREVECQPRNLEVPSSIPRSGCQLWDFFIGPHIQREYWCSSQEAESREISISYKNLFLNRCKINTFKLKLRADLSVNTWFTVLGCHLLTTITLHDE